MVRVVAGNATVAGHSQKCMYGPAPSVCTGSCKHKAHHQGHRLALYVTYASLLLACDSAASGKTVAQPDQGCLTGSSFVFGIWRRSRWVCFEPSLRRSNLLPSRPCVYPSPPTTPTTPLHLSGLSPFWELEVHTPQL